SILPCDDTEQDSGGYGVRPAGSDGSERRRGRHRPQGGGWRDLSCGGGIRARRRDGDPGGNSPRGTGSDGSARPAILSRRDVARYRRPPHGQAFARGGRPPAVELRRRVSTPFLFYRCDAPAPPLGEGRLSSAYSWRLWTPRAGGLLPDGLPFLPF